MRAQKMTSACKVLIAAAALAMCMLLAAGCSGGNTNTNGGKASNAPVKIGTMPTEDILPMWVAEKNGLFASNDVSAEIVTFDSAQALSNAIVAGQVDMAMVDVMRAAKLCDSGTPVVIEWTTLGTDASQGAFGVLAAADAPYNNLKEMADYLKANPDKPGVGVAANTVPEYVYESLCKQAGLDPKSIPVQEVASLPERYSLAANGKIAAAALPASLLYLGQASGMKVLAIDTQGENLSQSVMIATEKFASNNEEAIKKVAKAWDAAVDAIAADPGAYRSLLVQKANLNEKISNTYPISNYPKALNANGEFNRTPASLVEPQLVWMKDHGYSSSELVYDEKTGVISKK